MLRLITLAVLISNTSAKVSFSDSYDEVNGVEPKIIQPVTFPVEYVNKGDPLWVLSLSDNDWMEPKLRLGNTTEVEEFFHYVEPLIVNARWRRLRPTVRVKKDDSERPGSTDDLAQISINDVIKEFTIMINKFALSTSIEPDAYIADNSHSYDISPSITLNFKGPYSVLIVELRRNQWHYSINSQTSLPGWFYEKHDPLESPILIPEVVKIQLFRSLWRLLHVFFGFPV